MSNVMAKVATKSPLIFSVVAVIGVVGTAVCAVRDYKKSKAKLDAYILEHEKAEAEIEKEEDKTPAWPEKKFNRFIAQRKVDWTAWIPTAAVGVSTIACIILAHKVSAAQLAAVSAAAAFGGKKLSEQKYRLKKLIGEKNYNKLESYISGKDVEKSGFEEKDGFYPIHEQYTGMTIYAKPEDVLQVILDTEHDMSSNGIVIFDDYFKRLEKIAQNDLKPFHDKGFKAMGWSAETFIENESNIWIGLKLEERTSESGKKYFEIKYPYDPTTDYIKVSIVDDIVDDEPVIDADFLELPMKAEAAK